MILLWLACASGEGPDPVGDGGSTPSTTLAPEPLRSPAEAEDLDPAEGVLHVRLRAERLHREIVDPVSGAVREVEGYAWSGQVPGPTLRLRRGDTLIAEIENALEDPTTVHWHGLDVPYAMDGVTWADGGIAPGGSFTAQFTVEQAGTFWYHPHHDSDRQVDLGLYGLVIVEDPDEPALDELLVVLDADAESADPAADTGASTTGEEAGHAHGAHGTAGAWLVNGARLPEATLAADRPLRVRLLNASNTAYAWLDTAAATVLALDQGRLPAPMSTDRLLLAPGDRAELLWQPGLLAPSLAIWPYDLRGGASHGDREELASLAVEGDAQEADGTLPAFPWQEAPPSEDPPWTDVLWTLQGEEHTDTWKINGEQYPEVTIPVLSLGQEAVIEVRNLSATEHPFHLHGSRFELLSQDGQPPAQRRVEDTVNVPIHARIRLKLQADNPGDWMAHCHILPHAEGGMMTVLRVE